MSETDLMRSIRAAVYRQAGVMLWRNNTGVDLQRGVRYGLGVGSSDLIGVLNPSGRFVALEVKMPRGRVSPEQTTWMDAVRRAGGFAAVVRSEAEALAAIDRAKNGGEK